MSTEALVEIKAHLTQLVQTIQGHLALSATNVSELMAGLEGLEKGRDTARATQARQALATLQGLPADELRQVDAFLKARETTATVDIIAAGSHGTQDAKKLPSTSPVLMNAGDDFDPSFDLVRKKRIPELNVTAELYVHRATGARHVHLRSEDGHNAFSVAFPTVPQNSTGVAHVLEHTVLCGSERFPVRDPFFLMTRRTLSTFMNAMTASDFTYYPFSTQNQKDFDNLLDVYLDATFFPRLDEQDFLQEGIRVEPSDPNDPNSELTFKGVVFNEMKGALGDPVRRAYEALKSHLYPSSTYHHISGGDPADIPDLTHEALEAFHARHYHPSNAVFYSYGNFPLAKQQRELDDHVLSRFTKEEIDVSIADEPRLPSPVAVTEHYPLAPSEPEQGKTHIVLGWLLGESNTPEQRLEGELLARLLLGTSASPLQKALETTDLGASPYPYSGVDTDKHEGMFMCGLSGSEPEKAEAAEALVLDVLRDVADNGLAYDQVEAVLHQLELEQLEIVSGQGLELLGRALPAILHGADPIDSLNVGPVLAGLREKIRDPEYVKGLVRSLLDNPHRVRLTFAPDHGLAEKHQAAEKARLEEIARGLSPEDRVALAERAKQLKARQEAKQNADLLPTVTVDDIPTTRKIPKAADQKVAGIEATWFDAPTNGLVTERVVVEVPELEPDLLDVLPLFAEILTEVGVGDADYLEIQKQREATIGSLSASVAVRSALDDTDAVTAAFTLTGTGLARNQDALGAQIRDTLVEARFDELSRLRDIVSQLRMHQEQALTRSGHLMAVRASVAGLGPSGALAHRWNGIGGLQSLRELSESLQDEAKLAELADKLTRVRDALLGAPRRLVVVAEGKEHTALRETLDRQWKSVGPAGGSHQPFSSHTSKHEVETLWTTSIPVSYAAKSYPAVPEGHPDAAALQVLGNFLRAGYLHSAVREKGGAYGAGAFYNANSGSFSFYSYRDPRSVETLEEFDNSIRWLLDTEHEPRQLQEAIFGVIASIDSPSSPAGEALITQMESFRGRDPRWRQQARQAVLGVTIDDLKRVAREYLLTGDAAIAVLSNDQQADKAREAGLAVEPL